ncbi:hypothetical protein THRCLA_07021 [Thraustotheca clavata]|uniref:EF-hand domain-containing protein n=1 Tax=Thraustotheca clavata TaxID=74557 RepID=A0A1V9ZH44_9STRA|nr:hypothetical protein THRCLA_07021 [Thraustotheca clavata]
MDSEHSGRRTQFKDALKVPLVDNAMHWISFFQAICPLNETATMTRLNIPDTILLNSSNGCPNVWFHSNSEGLLKRKQTNHVSPNAIAIALGHGRKNKEIPVAICRFGFSSHLITRDQLHTLCEQMNAHAVEPMVASEQSCDPPVIPFCLQRYIKPLDNKRYIVSYSLAVESQDGKTTSPHMCEVFLAQYSKRYCSSRDFISHSQHVDKDTQDRHHLFNNPQMSFNFHTALGTGEAKVVSPVMRMKHLTTVLVHTINSRKSQNAQRIHGMVCEYIIGEADEEIYFTAILGVSWQDQPEPSWNTLRHVDPESKMIWQYHKDRAKRKEGSPRRPIVVHEAPPNTHLQSPRFPSLSKGQVSLNNDSWTKGLISADMSPRYTNASPSKFFRDGRFITKLSPKQCESACRMHVPIHRSCRPALLVDLARQVEDYREELVEQKEKCLIAQEEAASCTKETQQAVATKQTMESIVHKMQAKHELDQQRWARLYMQSEERETQALNTIQKQTQAIQVLIARNTAEDISLRRELFNCNEQLKQLHQTEVVHLESLAQKDQLITELEAEREKTRQQAVVDAIQREGSQSHIHALRAQISLLKRDKEVLRKEANKYMLERDDLLRVLPMVTSLTEKRMGKPLKMNLLDLVGQDNLRELNVLQLMVTSQAKLLKSIYKHLSAAATKNLETTAFYTFANHCSFITESFTREEISQIIQKACFSKDKDATTTLSYAQFCECLVRIANIRYLTEQQQLTKRFGCLVDKDLLLYAHTSIPSVAKFDAY